MAKGAGEENARGAEGKGRGEVEGGKAAGGDVELGQAVGEGEGFHWGTTHAGGSPGLRGVRRGEDV